MYVCVYEVMPSQPWSGKSRRIHLGREENILDRAVPALVGKVAAYPPWSRRGSRRGSRRIRIQIQIA